MAIANPSQELLMRSAFAADLVMNKAEASIRYIENAAMYNERRAAEGIAPAAQSVPGAAAGTGAGAGSGSAGVAEGKGAAAEKGTAVAAGSGVAVGHGVDKGSTQDIKQDIFNDVLKGKKKLVATHVEAALEQGAEASDILNEALIPAINLVGQYFNDKKYFLPQLMLSAEAMRKGVDLLEPLLMKNAEGKSGYTVVIATVEGDIHDIGKNLVAMMMKNYGFNVIDLGKDVPARTIVQAAIENDADIIALSALMTTTMQRMREVVALVQEKKLRSKVIIGGAVITQDYADEIGADGYSEDAVEAVALVKRLMEKG